MKKIIVLLTTIISINLFGGVLHPDVDMRIIGKIGGGTDQIIWAWPSFNYGIDTQIKGDVYKSDEFNTYLGGKLDFRGDVHHYGIVAQKFDYSIIPSGFIGFEESFKDLKFYQQLELGLGYKYSDNLADKNNGVFSSGIELGVNYKNVLFTFDAKPEITFFKLRANRTFEVSTILQLGIGYEF